MAITSYDGKTINLSGGSLLAQRSDNLPASWQFDTKIGERILSAFEPSIRADIEKTAKTQAAEAPIVRNPDGSYEQMNIPDGGSYYQDVYEEAIRTRYANQMYFDFQTKADEIAAQNSRDPNRANAMMQGLRDGMLKNADPLLKAEIEPVLAREIVQRYGGIVSRVAEEDRRTVVNDMDSQIRSLIENYQQRIAANDLPGAKAVYERTMTTARNLASMGVIGKTGVEAIGIQLESGGIRAEKARQADIRAEEIQRRAIESDRIVSTSLNNLPVLTQPLASLEAEDLLNLRQWQDGIKTDRVIKMPDGTELTFDKVREMLPHPAAMNQFGNAIGTALNVKDIEQRRANEEAKRATLINSIKDQQSLARVPNYGKDEKDLLDPTIMAGITQRLNGAALNLNDPVHRQLVVGTAVNNAYVPRAALDFMQLGVMSLAKNGDATNLESSLDLYRNILEATRPNPRPDGKGEQLAIGGKLLEDLDPKAEKALRIAYNMSRGSGLPPALIANAVTDSYNGTGPTKDDAIRAFEGNYFDARSQKLNEKLGFDETRALPPMVVDRYDEIYAASVNTIGSAAAADLAASSVASGFKSDKRFAGGWGDTRFDELIPEDTFVEIAKRKSDGMFNEDSGYFISIKREGVLPTYNVTTTDEYGNLNGIFSIGPEDYYKPSAPRQTGLTPEQIEQGNQERAARQRMGESILNQSTILGGN